MQVHIASADDPAITIIDKNLEAMLGSLPFLNTPIREYLGELNEKTVYKMTDTLGLGYIYFLLPDMPENTVIFIGPYSSAPISAQQILEIEERNGIQPKLHRFMTDYFSSIPTLPDGSHIFAIIDTFAEIIWGTPSFSVIDIDRERTLPTSPINESGEHEEFDSILINMNLMEKRYRHENELMQAVTLGQINKANILLSSLSDMSFEKRVSDPVRNLKNYCIITNTLLRKAAEAGGVHPIYLDNVSSAFAEKIEQISTTREGNSLMHDMFSSYCRLVRKHSMKSYSQIVQKAIIFIESDLSANLSLSSIAQAQNVSAGYLSAVFKRETSKTVTEYIAEKRIKHAMHLLSTTHLQIQTVALHCGIMDVQYFSKIFKKHTGKTPKEYRESLK